MFNKNIYFSIIIRSLSLKIPKKKTQHSIDIQYYTVFYNPPFRIIL